jgi:chromate reductase, NAD(P)H dehydrogenase (quinone)
LTKSIQEALMLTILTIAGSLRGDSYNGRLLREAGAQAPAGVRMTAWDGLRDVPAFDEDLESAPAPQAVAELRAAIESADAILIATPEYNGSVPGALKNALDWASRPHRASALTGKPVAVIGASPSPRGARAAVDDLCRVLGVIGAEVHESAIAVESVHERFGEDGSCDDDVLRRRLREITEDLAAQATEPPALTECA